MIWVAACAEGSAEVSLTMSCPSASSASQPYRASAARFHARIVPSGDVTISASPTASSNWPTAIGSEANEPPSCSWASGASTDSP